MKMSSVVRVVIAAVAIVLLAGPRVAEAKGGCSVESLEGSYGYTVTGTNLSVGQGAAVGVVRLDGKGGLVASDTLAIGGSILPRTITGTYTVNAAACTGNAVFTDNNGQTTHLAFVVVHDGQEVMLIETDPGTVFTGVGKRQ
jgi:hypothetical protein